VSAGSSAVRGDGNAAIEPDAPDASEPATTRATGAESRRSRAGQRSRRRERDARASREAPAVREERAARGEEMAPEQSLGQAVSPKRFEQTRRDTLEDDGFGEADGDGDSEEFDGEVDGVARRSTASHRPDASRIAQHLARFSDRAIQRVTGGNAFLRGRLYARRGHVHDLATRENEATCRVQVKQDTHYDPKLVLGADEQWGSQCNCPGFRGPQAHCKHVAALMVALRDRERPPRGAKPAAMPVEPEHEETVEPEPKPNGKQEVVAHSPQTVSVGGKRRSRRRRRRGGASEGAVEVVAAKERESSLPPEIRGGNLDAWLPPPAEQARLPELEFRMQVRSASIVVTPVLPGTRTPVPIADILAGFNAIPTSQRPLVRSLARHTSRNLPASAELRGEDAAEVLSMLRDRRVLLEPNSMELRFVEEPLRPRIELDQANAKAVRVRVVFESGPRRFALSTGSWFEGTPGWHIDPVEGFARPVADIVTPAWLTRLYRSPAIVHPSSELPRLLTELVPRVASMLGAELPDLAQVADLVDEQPRFVLITNGDIIEARAKLQAGYGEHSFPVPPSGFPSPLAFLPPAGKSPRPQVVRRDVGAEMAAVQRLLNLGFAPDAANEGLEVRGDGAVTFWTHGIAELPREWDKRVPDDLVRVSVRATPVTPQMRVSSGVDWLSLDMSFSTEGVAVDQEELRACLEHGRNLVRLADGSYAPVRAEDVAQILQHMAEIYAGVPDAEKLPLSQAGRIQDLMRLVGDAKVTPGAKELFAKLGDAGDITPVPRPRNLKVANFRDYQKRGFSWLVFLSEMGAGGILADDMGLGKTLQTIALLLWAKNKGKRKLSLVIAPTSVVSNWQREIEKFAPALETVVWQGPDRHEQRVALEEADVMITSYALLRRDEELLQQLDLRYVVLDEAQHIKNPLSATARAAKALRSEHRLALTGTPIENRLSEIWSIFDFVSPGLLGTLKSFDERYSRPIDRGDQEAQTRLRTIIHPLVMRRTKVEVAPELPEKIEQEIIIPMADEQAKLYKQMLKQVRDSVLSAVEQQGVNKAQIQILAALTRMRQVACDPRLTNLSGEWSAETSGKIQALKEIVEEAVSGGHRILVFSQFVQMLQLIRQLLDECGVTYEYLDGSTKDRQERVDRFNRDETINAFLISLKAGGTGLNLTGADTVVHFDPWWNPAVEDQATDRAHRIGQSKVVTVYKLIARDSVEEKILALSEKKRELVSSVLTTESTPLKGLTKQDIDDLFS
jgi:superfamily II DNA or RNA helicase